MRGARSDQRVVNERSAGSTQLIEKVGSSESCGLLKDSRSWRQMQAEGFVVAVLYGTLVDEDVPLRAWLADDLVVVFESLVIDRVYGTESRLLATAPDMLPPDVPSGRRPKRAGPSLEDYAHRY
jgi:hypothetical protein